EDEFGTIGLGLESLVLSDRDGARIDRLLVHAQLSVPVHLLAGHDVPARFEVDGAQTALDLLDAVQAAGDLPLPSLVADADGVDLFLHPHQFAGGVHAVPAAAAG